MGNYNQKPENVEANVKQNMQYPKTKITGRDVHNNIVALFKNTETKSGGDYSDSDGTATNFYLNASLKDTTQIPTRRNRYAKYEKEINDFLNGGGPLRDSDINGDGTDINDDDTNKLFDGVIENYADNSDIDEYGCGCQNYNNLNGGKHDSSEHGFFYSTESSITSSLSDATKYIVEKAEEAMDVVQKTFESVYDSAKDTLGFSSTSDNNNSKLGQDVSTTSSENTTSSSSSSSSNSNNMSTVSSTSNINSSSSKGGKKHGMKIMPFYSSTTTEYPMPNNKRRY
ncbi:hypothetical protein Hokovirus_4_69 [Hokovirus HKV1]|uniref:Uncharacterized protein n=1 Tax=Hokovirus HKV1 TaxID=1977638 RepID=A0A1V0SHA1_9VIRU|nr:hypothetical protein Hokovirus_4_69 [Hokovirus HKV1]